MQLFDGWHQTIISCTVVVSLNFGAGFLIPRWLFQLFFWIFPFVEKFCTNPWWVSSWNITKSGALAREFSYFQLYRPSRTIRPCQAFFYDCAVCTAKLLAAAAATDRPTEPPPSPRHIPLSHLQSLSSLSLSVQSRPTTSTQYIRAIHSRNTFTPSFVPLPQYTLAPRLNERVTVWPAWYCGLWNIILFSRSVGRSVVRIINSPPPPAYTPRPSFHDDEASTSWLEMWKQWGLVSRGGLRI